MKDKASRKEQWACITGAAQGLGSHFAIFLAKQGYQLLLHYFKSKQEAEQLKNDCESYGVSVRLVQADLLSSSGLENVQNALRSLEGKLDLLVNNASIYLVKQPSETSLHEMQAQWGIHVSAPCALIQSALPSLVKNQGLVVNMGTVGLHTARANSYHSAYYASKLSLYAMSKSFAKEFRSQRVRVNMLSPAHLPNSLDLESFSGEKTLSWESVCSSLHFLLQNPEITGQNLELGAGFAL